MSLPYVEPELIRSKPRSPFPFLLLAPALALLLLFLVYPLLWLILVSLTDYDPVTASARSVGLSYYRQVISSPAIWRGILVMGYFALVYMPLTLAGAALIALLLRRGVAGSNCLRLIFCTPALIPAVAAALLWRAAYEPFGTLDRFLYTFFRYDHAPGWAGWLAEPYLATPCIALMCAWRDLGLFALILAAALARIPAETYELARVDGASRWQTFRHVTLPAAAGTLTLCLVLLVINVQNVFQEIYVMTEDGGPANWSLNVPFLVYRYANWTGDWGHAAALSVVLFTVTVVVILIQNRLLNRRFGWS